MYTHTTCSTYVHKTFYIIHVPGAEVGDGSSEESMDVSLGTEGGHQKGKTEYM